MEEYIEKSWFSIGRCNKSMSIYRNLSQTITVVNALKGQKVKNIRIRTNKRKPVLYPTIQFVVVILYTKYELSILYSCGDILTKDVERKYKGHIQGSISGRMPVLNPTM